MAIDVKATIEASNLTTARGRQTLKGREVKVCDVTQDEKRRAAFSRAEIYLDVARTLRRDIERTGKGISAEELGAVDFIVEFLDGVARTACESAIEAND